MDSEQRKQSTEDHDERKQAPSSRRLPHALLDEVHSDFALAMVLQEQERAFMALTSIESDSEEEESEEESNHNEDNDYEYFESHDFEAEQGFLEEEEEGSNSGEDMEEDDIDLDELTYEELIALGEFIGQEKKGLPTEQIPAFLHPCEYQALESKTGVDRCVICQMEYEGGERLVALPCEHRYHSECISNWLQINKICPICSAEVSSPLITRNG